MTAEALDVFENTCILDRETETDIHANILCVLCTTKNFRKPLCAREINQNLNVQLPVDFCSHRREKAVGFFAQA